MNRKRVLLAVIPSLIILGVLLYVWSITLVFTLANELDVETTATDTTFSSTNGESIILDFRTIVDSPNTCSTRCEFTLRDVSTNEVVYSRIQKVNTVFDLEISYNINETSDGEKFLSYDVACNNLVSAICSTSQEVYYESTFISIEHKKNEYQLSEEATVRRGLENSLLTIATINNFLEESEFLLSELNFSSIETDELFDSLDELNATTLYYAEQTQQFQNQWVAGEYLEINQEALQSLQNILSDIERRAFIQQNNSQGLIVQYNDAITKINTLRSKQKLYSYLEEYQRANGFAIDLIKFNSDVRANNNILLKKNFLSLFEVQNNVEALVSLAPNIEIEYDGLVALSRKDVRDATYLWHSENITSIDLACQAIDKSLEAIQAHDIQANTTLQRDYVVELANASFNQSLADYALAVYKNISFNDTSYPYEDIVAYHEGWTIDILDLRDRFCFTPKKPTALSNISQLSIQMPEQDVVLPSLPSPKKIFCIYGTCSLVEEKTHYPLVLVHGHALTSITSAEAALHAFSKIQHNLESSGYVNVGELNDYPQTSWESIPAPISVRVSYYYLPVSELGQYQFYTKKYESIETYAIRLKEVIDEVKEKTGEDKVIILAHSMGGLVTRKYLSIFGEDSVDKAILVATPNNGVVGASKRLCSLTGANKECEEMTQGSLFLKRLSAFTPTKTKIYTIAGAGCAKDGNQGDGVVNLMSVQLEYANNSVVEGSCNDALQSSLHKDLIDPDLYPQVLERIEEILLE